MTDPCNEVTYGDSEDRAVPCGHGEQWAGSAFHPCTHPDCVARTLQPGEVPADRLSPLPAECCEGVCDGIPHDDDCETPLWEEIDRLKRERDEAITALHQLYKHDRIADARRILFDAGRLDCDTKAGSDCA